MPIRRTYNAAPSGLPEEKERASACSKFTSFLLIVVRLFQVAAVVAFFMFTGLVDNVYHHESFWYANFCTGNVAGAFTLLIFLHAIYTFIHSLLRTRSPFPAQRSRTWCLFARILLECTAFLLWVATFVLNLFTPGPPYVTSDTNVSLGWTVAGSFRSAYSLRADFSLGLTLLTALSLLLVGLEECCAGRKRKGAMDKRIADAETVPEFVAFEDRDEVERQVQQQEWLVMHSETGGPYAEAGLPGYEESEFRDRVPVDKKGWVHDNYFKRH